MPSRGPVYPGAVAHRHHKMPGTGGDHSRRGASGQVLLGQAQGGGQLAPIIDGCSELRCRLVHRDEHRLARFGVDPYRKDVLTDLLRELAAAAR